MIVRFVERKELFSIFCGGQIGIELLLGIISGVRCKVILDTWYVDCFEDNEMFIGSR